MRQLFWGDGYYVLPTNEKEPYRLWFEWLKLAQRDSEVCFTDNRYDAWGDVQDTPFEDWWDENWRTLFGMTAGVRELLPRQVVPQGNGFVILFVPLTGTRDKIGYQVAQIVAEHPQFEETGERPAPPPFNLSDSKGQKAPTKRLSNGFLKSLTQSRRYLRLYQLWLEHGTNDKDERLELATRAFVLWHQEHPDEAIGSVGQLNENYKVYDAFLRERDLGSRGNMTTFTRDNSLNPNAVTAAKAHDEVARDLKRARNIAKNLAKGQFPGDYSSV